ncbi:MAG: class I SAM-dependent rRNA methyltransferase [Bacteroidetes bacterium]|nr:class I SAM-dependent rRNA methyltransferase [Bacteroidota bacterium]
MTKTFPQIILSSGKDQSLRRFHPWVFSGAIKKVKDKLQLKDGDIVEVVDNKDEFLGIGHYQESSISVRIFSFEKINPDAEFWRSKIQKAFDFRKKLGLTDNPHTNCYRLLFGEGDGLPGLIIDYYNGTCVMQCHSIGMHLMKNEIVEAVKEVYGEKLVAVYDKSSETLPKIFAAGMKNEYLFGEGTDQQHLILENDSTFWADWKSGQKTGFFLDQRENRQMLGRYSEGKTVMNAFCYTGAFSVYALKAGATEVHSVDSSKRAIELTEKNVKMNTFSGKHKSYSVDVFDFLKDKKDVYDVMVLDPPAFAKHHDVRHNAVMGYKRLNSEALKQIKSGGILFTFSCSQVIDRPLFEKTIMSAAIVAGRNVRVLHHLSQAPDHAVNIFHPEGEYLKGLVLFVE